MCLEVQIEHIPVWGRHKRAAYNNVVPRGAGGCRGLSVHGCEAPGCGQLPRSQNSGFMAISTKETDTPGACATRPGTKISSKGAPPRTAPA
eukprot:CAMPEP_0173403308 /NCGR_PEP_ID=MMETSP1356-20130122/56445_1 /TAXON_ID=77927 ORGANISM="Hemiselmis virescens, Strain PCC157" /NCGR_SAMPLE_ID=MMETSP1356 /ASSEMBLY_ACC=CAM_ASM_000847 /LENGTH=90 /DNA_ID=CAMNT_0014363815 /DNA_START=234 /DNA_END=503 /DNA_ORIENTATION=+